MWKNKEVKWVFIMALCLAAGIAAVSKFCPAYTAAAALISFAVLTAAYIISMVYRLRKIRKLSDDLYMFSENGGTLKPGSCTEGELSLLQSEIYKLSVRLTEQAELLKQDKSYLADAISDISHQLKTPVTSMRVMADLLGDGTLPDKKRQTFTANIQSQLNRMEWLVTALLKMAKLDAGAVTMKCEPFMIGTLVRRASEHLLIPMELKNIMFETSGDMEAETDGDIGWLSEAVANILKNCIEHTQAGGKITICAEKTALYTSIAVSDTGCGISDEDLPHIFERFYKGSNSASDSAGIGLAMAKQIVTEMNGVLTVSETGADGTAFLIKLYRR